MQKLHQKIVNMMDSEGWKIKRKNNYYVYLKKDREIIKVSIETGNIMPSRNIKQKS